jgi:hypothetical protein
MHLWLLVKDAWRTGSWHDKFRIWFQPTGWRPADVAAKFPVYSIEAVPSQLRYHTHGSALFYIWTVFQLLLTLGLMMYFFKVIGTLEPVHILLYGLFLFVMIFGYTSLMDGSALGMIGEGVKACLGYFLMATQSNSWFGMESVLFFGNQFMLAYLGISVLVASYFYFLDRPQEDFLPVAKATVMA